MKNYFKLAHRLAKMTTLRYGGDYKANFIICCKLVYDKHKSDINFVQTLIDDFEHQKENEKIVPIENIVRTLRVWDAVEWYINDIAPKINCVNEDGTLNSEKINYIFNKSVIRDVMWEVYKEFGNIRANGRDSVLRLFGKHLKEHTKLMLERKIEWEEKGYTKRQKVRVPYSDYKNKYYDCPMTYKSFDRDTNTVEITIYKELA